MLTPIYSNVKQGSVEWFAARLGIPTASRFDDIVTSQGKPSKGKGRNDYLCELVGERLTGQLTSHFTTPAMERGTMLEPTARAWYEFETDRKVRQVGFVTTQEHKGRFGCSPDGICDDRGLEIKCPGATNMIRLLLASAEDASSDYYHQCQAAMWMTGLDKWDLCLFTDVRGIPNRVITINADPAIHAAFATHILAFCDEVDAAEAKMKAMGAGGFAAASPSMGLRDNSADIMQA